MKEIGILQSQMMLQSNCYCRGQIRINSFALRGGGRNATRSTNIDLLTIQFDSFKYVNGTIEVPIHTSTWIKCQKDVIISQRNEGGMISQRS